MEPQTQTSSPLLQTSDTGIKHQINQYKTSNIFLLLSILRMQPGHNKEHLEWNVNGQMVYFL